MRRRSNISWENGLNERIRSIESSLEQISKARGLLERVAGDSNSENSNGFLEELDILINEVVGQLEQEAGPENADILALIGEQNTNNLSSARVPDISQFKLFKSELVKLERVFRKLNSRVENHGKFEGQMVVWKVEDLLARIVGLRQIVANEEASNDYAALSGFLLGIKIFDLSLALGNFSIIRLVFGDIMADRADKAAVSVAPKRISRLPKYDKILQGEVNNIVDYLASKKKPPTIGNIEGRLKGIELERETGKKGGTSNRLSYDRANKVLKYTVKETGAKTSTKTIKLRSLEPYLRRSKRR